jgi:myo-inositol-1(or 4)-monophosphatase
MAAAMREAGELALRYFGARQTAWTKGDGTPVSEADLAVDALLKDRLLQAFPDHGWLSEETRDSPERLGRRRVWVVDPIDGTSAFLKRDRDWSIAVACIADGRPVVAGVLQPLASRYFDAMSGGGARLDGRPIQTTARRGLEGAKLISKRKFLNTGRWTKPWPEVELGMVASIALRLCHVAMGEFDGVVAAAPKSDWDVVAGDLIVHEAGGRMSDLDGRLMLYNRRETRQKGLLAAGAHLFDQILARTATLEEAIAGESHG